MGSIIHQFRSVYNPDFNLISIIIFLIVFVSYLQKKHVNHTQHKLFLILFSVSIITPITNLISAYLMFVRASDLIIHTTTTICYLSKQLTNFLFLLYIISHVELKKSFSLLKKWILAFPIFLVAFIILSNPFTKIIYSYSDGAFVLGSGRIILLIMSVFYYFVAVSFLHKNRHLVNHNLISIIHVITMLNIWVEIFQYFNSTVNIQSLAVSLSLLILILNIERYGMVVDSLTGFARREHFEMICNNNIQKNIPFKIIVIRIKDYDHATIMYGVSTIERVLIEIKKLLMFFTETGRSFQISNDLFALIVNEKTDIEEMRNLIYASIKKPVKVDGVDVSFQINVLSLDFPNEVEEMESIMGIVQYVQTSNILDDGIVSSVNMLQCFNVNNSVITDCIKKGLKHGHFEVVYQPICTSNDKKFVSAEALLRLKSPEMGYIAPSVFIPVAEKNGLILQVGNYVLDSVCNFIEHNNMEELGLEYLEVNLSIVQLLQSNFIDTINSIVKKHNVNPKYLCFEMTETASPALPEILEQNLKALVESGYSLALDDFGTGYGNLKRMITSNFKIVKFDKSMTEKLTGDANLRKVYATLQKVIDTLGAVIVSEGVETEEQYECVKKAGSHYIQGYLFSKPLNTNDFLQFIQSNK